MRRRRWIHRGNERTVLVCARIACKFAISPKMWLQRIARTAVFCVDERWRIPRAQRLKYLRASLGRAWHLQRKALASNRREQRLSSSPLRAWVAPVRLSLGGLCIIAERATMVRGDDEAGIAHICRIRDHIDRLWKTRCANRDFDEIASDLSHTFHDSNFGYIDGRLVLVDYGAEALEMLYAAAPQECLRCFEAAALEIPAHT